MTVNGTPRKLGPNSTFGFNLPNEPNLVSGAALSRTAQAAIRFKYTSWPISDTSFASSAVSAGHSRMKSFQSNADAVMDPNALAGFSTAAAAAKGNQRILRLSTVTPGDNSFESGIQVMQPDYELAARDTSSILRFCILARNSRGDNPKRLRKSQLNE